MAFGSLLGGIVTLVGTSPNIIVSRVREEILGAPFEHVRLHAGRRLLAIGGVAFLAFGWRLLPERKGAASMDAAFNLEGYTTEVTVPEDIRLRRQDREGPRSARRGRGRGARDPARRRAAQFVARRAP